MEKSENFKDLVNLTEVEKDLLEKLKNQDKVSYNLQIDSDYKNHNEIVMFWNKFVE